jgi:hypothetical protein
MSVSEKKGWGGISKVIITPTTTYMKMILSGCEYPHRLARYPISIIISPYSDCEVLLFTWDPHDQINFNPTSFKNLRYFYLKIYLNKKNIFNINILK